MNANIKGIKCGKRRIALYWVSSLVLKKEKLSTITIRFLVIKSIGKWNSNEQCLKSAFPEKDHQRN